MENLTLNPPYQYLVADRTGALVWPNEQLLIVADLHLEKGSFFARRGAALPPYDSRASIERLEETLRRWAPKRVISLGDAFHDPAGCARLSKTDRQSIRRLTSIYDWIWILGNHDPDPPRDLGGTSAEAVDLQGMTFRHIPSDEGADGEVAGHLHPKASVLARGRRVSRPCFVSDDRRILLPAFGCYTGGLDILNTAVASLFPHDYRAYLLGGNRVYKVARRQLEKPVS